MTPDITLHHKLSEASRRIRLLMVYHWTARTVCWTTLACVLWLVASRFNWVSEPQANTLVGILITAVVAGIVLGATRRLTTMDVARLTDRRLSTKDRLASAIEFEREPAGDPLFQQQIADAGAHAKALDIRRAYPFKLSREAVISIVLVLALFGAFFLPKLPMFWSQEKKDEMKEVKAMGIQIEKLATDTQKTSEAKKLEEAAKAAKEAKKLAEAMRKGEETKKSAMIKLTKLTRDIEEQQRKMAQANSPNQKPMSQAAKEAKDALDKQQKAVTDAVKTAQKEQVGKKGENAQDKQQNGDKKNDGAKPGEKQGQKPGESQQQQSEAMKQAQLALQKFSQALMDQNGEAQNQALQQLADQMEKGDMSKAEMGQLQQQIQQMSQALKGTDLDKASKQMQQMAEMMKQMKIDPETLKKLASMMRQAGGT